MAVSDIALARFEASNRFLAAPLQKQAEVLREPWPELRAPRQRHHERGVDPGCVERDAGLQQVRIVGAVRLELSARALVAPFKDGERECREVELARGATRRREVVPKRTRQAVPEVRVAV